MKTFIISLFLICGFSLHSQINISNNDLADIAIIKDYYKTNGNTKSLQAHFAVNAINGIDYLSFLAKINPNFNELELTDQGVMVGAKINDIISIKCPIDKINYLLDNDGIHTLQVAGKVKPTLNKVLWDIRADSVHQGINLPQSYTGKNVLIGVTDWGFDYTHPMFYDTLLQDTRILAAWDQFKTSGPAPSGYSYGTEYATPTDLINAEADTANIYSYALHGTHVAGITGGSGAGTSFRGVAFESQFLFTTFLVDEAAVMDAWQWMYDKSVAEDKRLVINMSWGLYHTGALDGSSLLSQALDAFTDLGVLFVTSAGNNGDSNFHIKKTYSSNTDTLLTNISFSSSAYSQYFWGQSIHAWGEAGKQFEARIKILDGTNQLLGESQLYSTLNTTTYVDSFVVYNGIDDTVWFNLSMDDAYPTNNKPQMRLRIKKPDGVKVVLQSIAESGTVHYWNVAELTTDVGNWGENFTALTSDYTAGDANYGIGAPACTETAISVAAYSAQTNTNGGPFIGGQLAYFSSVGPLSSEAMKPDVAAPGVSVGSSVSSFTDNSYTEATSVNFNGRDYPFARLSGTSMSSPVVAGVAALIWEANPYIAPWQVKFIIMSTAREDIKTGELSDGGDVEWGHGKIDAYQAIRKAIFTVGTEDVKEALNWSIYPNPANHQLNISDLGEGVTSIMVIDLNGKVCLQSENTTTLDVSGLTAGQYILRIVKNNKVEQQKFVIQ